MSQLPKTWVEAVAKIRQTLDVAAMLNETVLLQPDGAKALSEMLLRMASALDTAVQLREEEAKAVERKDGVLARFSKWMKGPFP